MRAEWRAKLDTELEASQGYKANSADWLDGRWADIKAAHCAFKQVKADEAPLIYLSYGMSGLFHKKKIGGIAAPYSALYDLHRLYRVH